MTNLLIVLLTIAAVAVVSATLIPLLNRRDESPEAQAERDALLHDELSALG